MLLDGQKIYIPNINEAKEEINIIKDNEEGVVIDNIEYEIDTNNLVININKAREEELEKLPGVGPATALKIIDYRNSNGKFKTIEEIKNVPGIGDAKFEAMKDFICLD